MVYIIGAGPGDPELITVKGQRLLKEADVIIYAGSLVNPALLNYAKADCEIYNSASMTLGEVIETITAAEQEGKMTVRLHTGDPAIYGAIQEQMDELSRRNIEYTVIPGVSSFLATAAALKQEYTLPEISQTVIITLKSLAAHQATMCIFLSVHMISEVVEQLIEGGYEPSTPIAIVQKASWPEQKIVRGTLETIADIVKENNISRTAMIVVSKCLDTEYAKSRLYSPEFSHMYRQGTDKA